MPTIRLNSIVRALIKRYRSIHKRYNYYENAPIALAVVTLKGVIVSMNHCFKSEFGYTEDDLPTIGNWWTLAYPEPDYRTRAKETWNVLVKQAIRTGGSLEAVEYLIHRKNGSSGTYLVAGNIVKNRILTSFTHVSELKKAEENLKKTEATSKFLLNAAPVYYIAIGNDGKVQAMNRSLAEKLEIEEEEAIGLDYLENFVPPEDRKALRWVMKEILQNHFTTVSSNWIISRSGKEYLVEWRGRHTINKDDNTKAIIGVGIDITQRERTKEILNSSEYRFKTLFEHIPIPLLIVSQEGSIRDYNQPFASLFGYTDEDFNDPKYLWSHLIPDFNSFDDLMKCWKKTLHPGSVLLDSLETRVISAEGTPLDVLMNASLLTEEILISYLDISNQKKAERSAQEAYKVLLSVFSGIEEAIYVVDPETYEVLYVNDHLRKYCGDAIGKTCYVQFQNRDSPCPFCTNPIIFSKDDDDAYIWEFYNEFIGRWYRCIDKAIRWPDGRRVRFEMAIDIDEQKGMEEALAESLERYRVLSESSSMGIWQLTREGKTVYANPAMRSLLGVAMEENLNQYSFLSFFISEQHESIKEFLYQERPPEEGTFETILIRHSGEKINVIISGAPLKNRKGDINGAIVGFLDITERKHTEAILLSTEKELMLKEKQQREQNESILKLIIQGVLQEDDFDSSVKKLTELAARLAQVRRASVWLYEDDDIHVHCIDMYDAPSKTHASGYEIQFDSSLDYISTLKKGELIAARRVREDPRTRELPASYFDQSGVCSLLDAPIKLGPNLLGIFCLEVVGEEREWEPDDERLAALFATTVSLAYQTKERRRAEEELKNLNSELEKKIAERTKSLEETNAELQALNLGLSKAMEDLKAAQSQVIAAEKMAALGRLMAGIAHELNTPLAAISASSKVLIENLQDDDMAETVLHNKPEDICFIKEARSLGINKPNPASELNSKEKRKLRKTLEELFRQGGVTDPDTVADDFTDYGLAELAEQALPFLAGPRGESILKLIRGSLDSYRAIQTIEDAIGKANRVVSALRTYTHGKGDEKSERIHLASEFRSLLDLYYNRTKQGIDIRLNIPDDLEVWGQREALNRIWFNTINNAVQAMGEVGTIDISVKTLENTIRVKICDSGPGIPEELQKRIFEPFFTTKPIGEGSGLGLDIAKRLAQENGGDISFTSRPGRTVFTVELPRPQEDPT